jgi:hypothetical protein
VEDYLKEARGLMALRMLVEGCSVRSVERIKEIRLESLLSLVVIAGHRCEALMNRIRGVEASEVQADEIWASSTRRKATKRLIPCPEASFLKLSSRRVEGSVRNRRATV